VLRELPDLREDAAALAAALARARYRRAAGLDPDRSLREILREHKLAAGSDGVQQAAEALQRARDEKPARPGRIARLGSLRDFLVRARALEIEPGAAQELFDLPRRPLVRPPGDAGLHGAIPPVRVFRDLPVERSREKRADLEAALSAALQPADPVRSAAFEAAQKAQSESALVLPPDTSDWAARALDGTDAVANDLGRWLLQRHAGVKPGTAGRHDVLHLVHAPRCASAFPAGEMERTVRRWVEMLRLDLSGVKLDAGDRPLKWPGAHAEALDPPYEAGLTFLPAEGPRALEALLGALGAALLRLWPPEGAPPEDLWLGDPVVRSACSALLEGLVRDRQWLRRCAKVELSRDDERAVGIAAAFDVRIAAARTLAAAQAHESGLGGRAAAAHRELYARATGAELPVGLALCDVDPWLGPLFDLQGRALAARARAWLRDAFDEDWWRNPRSVASLSALFGRGGRATGAELWAEMAAAPSVDPLLSELSESTR